MLHEKAASALHSIAPNERATWVRMAMALKSEFGDDAFDAWNSWSKSAESYCRKSALAVWRSIGSAGHVRIGTLYREAAANGWRYAEDHRVQPITRVKGERLLQWGAEAAPHSQTQPEGDVACDVRKTRAARAAAASATKYLAQCQPKTHPYLVSKGLPNSIGLVRGLTLIVPMYDFLTSELVGTQRIDWLADEQRWAKQMAWGMRVKGAALRLGNQRAQETFFCEGLATGLSIELALRRLRLNASVVVCFNDWNLAHVASLEKGRAFVFADNDVSLAGESAAKKTGLAYCMSDVVGEDANDLLQRAGVVELCRLIIDVRRRSG
ncbi:MAG TPA: PriCT-2 domain-containing protein [Telluria sp.]|jgi:putative DNA primase/helicase